jgi:hypothetical protein
MKTNIQKTIQDELQDFRNDITIIENWDFNQKKTIEQAILYFNSKFIDGDEVDGFKQFFFNIVRPACGTTTKAIDIDTKDILLLTAPGGDRMKTWFYQRSLKNWFKQKEFGKVLNRICEELPIFGTVVLKKVKGDVKFVNLKNFIVEQNADNLDQSNFIIEQHFYTRVEFKKLGEEKGWKNVNDVIKFYEGSKEQYIRVFERYGLIQNDDESVEYKQVLVADIPTDVKRTPGTQLLEINNNFILSEEVIDTHPYFEIHIFKVPGRWLGVGVPELLSDPQIRLNEITNQESRSSYWSALRLWQSTDSGIKRNLLKKAKDGDVLEVDDAIQPVAMEDRNSYASYQAQRESWKANVQELTFSYDVVRGQRTPAGTPLGSAQLSAAMSLSYFDQMKENIALDIKNVLWYVLEEFKKTASKAHIIRIAGEDMDKLTEMMVNTRAHKKFFDYISKNGRIPPPEFMDMVKEIDRMDISSKGELMVGAEEAYFGDVKYDIDIIITDESLDAATQASNLITALQTITTDPTILQDPTKKKIFGKYLESGGISLADIEANIPKSVMPPEINEVSGAGGGVSAPVKRAPGLQKREVKL